MDEEALKKKLITDILQVYAVGNLSKGNTINYGANDVFIGLVCLELPALIKIASELCIKI